MAEASAPNDRPGRPAGRPRDSSRDADIADAVLEALSEHGYEALTIDRVAKIAGAGKATIYRRWSSKHDLVSHAVTRLAATPTIGDLPDSGSLRGDLMTLMQPQSAADDERWLGLARGLASLLAVDEELADAAANAFVKPFVASQYLLISRAIERGEVGADIDVDTIADVLPSIAALRLTWQRRPIDVDYLQVLVDTIILPAVGLSHTIDPDSG